MSFSHKHRPRVKHTVRRRLARHQDRERPTHELRAVMVHVLAHDEAYWAVGLLALPDWQRAMDGANEGQSFYTRLVFWHHDDAHGGGRIRFPTDEDAWAALHQSYPELARPVLPRMLRDERDKRDEPTEPLTPPWLDQLAGVNLTQAVMAQLSQAQAGTTRCCVICGDTRLVADYGVLNGDTRPFVTRLCADCTSIQRSMGCQLGPARPLPPDRPNRVRNGA
jgi:hypothetical protein